jgi:site-specific recombinase XerD
MEHSHSEYLAAWKDAMRFGLLNGRPYSDACIKTYSLYVEKFLAECGEIKLEHYKTTLTRIPVNQFAKRLKLYEAINCFARYLVEEQVMDDQYLQSVKKYKPRRHLPPKKITVDQTGLESLLMVCTNNLERLFIILLSQTGLRVTEAANLELSDLDFERRILTVRLAKWGKTRRVGLTEQVIQAIQAYLPNRPNSLSAQLLLNRKGEPINRYGIRVRLEKLGRLAGVPVTPHALRRAFVTLNANKGRPLVMLQMACGHSDIATTRSYCLTTEDETIQAMQAWDYNNPLHLPSDNNCIESTQMAIFNWHTFLRRALIGLLPLNDKLANFIHGR